MRQYADIAIYGRDGSLQLLAEVKGKRDASPEWAARFRRNMYAHGHLPPVPYFLLALPDRFYLWQNLDNPFEAVEPDYSVDPSSLLYAYFERAATSVQAITEQSFEFIIVAWLETITSNGQASAREEWLQTSGLLDALRDGRIEIQALV